MEKIIRHTLNKSSIITSITNSFFKLMTNLRSTSNTILYLSNNLCKFTWNLHPLWIQKLPMDVAPKTLLFFLLSHTLTLLFFFHHYADCNFSYFLLCSILLYSLSSRCKTLPLYFFFPHSPLLFMFCNIKPNLTNSLWSMHFTKAFERNPNILVFLLALSLTQKIIFSSLGFTRFFSSPHRRGSLGQNH